MYICLILFPTVTKNILIFNIVIAVKYNNNNNMFYLHKKNCISLSALTNVNVKKRLC